MTDSSPPPFRARVPPSPWVLGFVAVVLVIVSGSASWWFNRGQATASTGGAVVAGVDLSRDDLSGISLQGADLSGTILNKAVLTGADLRGSLLAGTRSEDADFSGACLRDTTWTGATATSVVLDDANVTGADFSHARLSVRSAQDVRYDESTRWGAGGRPPEVPAASGDADPCS